MIANEIALTLKEARETEYWIDEIIRILVTTVKSSKENSRNF